MYLHGMPFVWLVIRYNRVTANRYLSLSWRVVMTIEPTDGLDLVPEAKPSWLSLKGQNINEFDLCSGRPLSLT